MRLERDVYYTCKRTRNGYVNLDRDFASIFSGDRHVYDNTSDKFCTFKQYVNYSTCWQSDTYPEHGYGLVRLNINDTITDPQNMYHTFSIPKRTGGYREICAPDDELKVKQVEILNALKAHCPYPHECAHAYTEERCPKTAMEVHLKNKSHWYLKLDIKSFFPSCTVDLVMDKLKSVYPFYRLDRASFDIIKKYCFKDGALPQGAPTSPYLSNIIMIPFDYRVSEYCREHSLKYTRYADDIIISGYEKFDANTVERIVKCALTELNYTTLFINSDKTRYGNASGRNWNLGLMVTNDKITVGNQRKRRMKQSLYNYQKTKDTWSLNDLQILLGELQYIISIEPDIYDKMYKPKFGDVKKEIIDQIKINLS